VVRYRRNFVPGGTFFFTVALADRRSTLLTASVDTLRGAFGMVRTERPFQIDAIVILPDHLHAIFTLPDGDADFPLRWRRIKTVFTRAVIAGGAAFEPRDGGGHALWQRRFWEHTIRDATDFSRHVDYIHYNPVKHGYVANALDWPHSSLHRFVGKGVLPPDLGGVAGDDGFGERAER
jgi:putative transposase